MKIQNLQLMAGTASILIFILSNFPMLWKAIKTKDLKSYSLGNMALRNLGNLLYWIYVTSLPMGPVWYLQTFFTLSGAAMLVCYLHYEKGWGLQMLARIKDPYKEPCTPASDSRAAE
jgi:hypothetical protein